MPRVRIKQAVRIALDWTALLFVGLMLLLIGRFEPSHRGFFCNDQSIRFPMHPEFITTVPLGLVCIALVFTTMCIAEYLRYRRGQLSPSTLQLLCMRIHPLVLELYRLIGVFSFGAGATVLITDIGKYSVGRLRPHFFTVCQPDLKDVDCGSHHYIDEYTCLGTDVDTIREARLSFPSGHASFSFYSMVYLVIYMQARLRCGGSRLIRPLLQLLCLILCWFTALSRISDYKHHPTDVAAGSLLGTTVAVIVAYVVLDLFEKRVLSSDLLTHKDSVEEAKTMTETVNMTEHA